MTLKFKQDIDLEVINGAVDTVSYKEGDTISANPYRDHGESFDFTLDDDSMIVGLHYSFFEMV